MDIWKKIVLLFINLLLIGGGIAIGWFSKPDTIIIKENVKYLPGQTIRDTITKPMPYEVNKPIDTLALLQQIVKDGLYAELFPERIDTVYLTKSDTTKIMSDWATLRKYEELLFASDTLGSCSVSMDVQYNRLQDLDFAYTPHTKVITEVYEKTRRFSPYIGIGMTSQPTVMGQLGAFFNNKYGLAFQYQYCTDLKKHVYGGMFLYMF